MSFKYSETFFINFFKLNRASFLMVEAVKVTKEIFKEVYPIANTDVIPHILKYAAKYEINTKKRMAAFLAMCFIESTGFRRSVENMKYSPSRLRDIFSSVKDLAQAQQLCAGGEKAIANYVYGNILGNRGRDTDDGYNYRGRCAIQVTGLSNYKAVKASTGIDCVNHPELLEKPEYNIIAAMDFWKRNRCNEQADKIPLVFNGYTIRKLDKNGNMSQDYRNSPELIDLRKIVNKKCLGLTDLGLHFENLMKAFVA